MSDRLGFTDRLIEFIQQHEGKWIDAIRFEQFWRQAWRTRLSEARLRLQATGQGTIENRVLLQHGSRVKRSQYRFVRGQPVALNRVLDLFGEQST
jgi:hypothetical protein